MAILGRKKVTDVESEESFNGVKKVEMPQDPKPRDDDTAHKGRQFTV